MLLFSLNLCIVWKKNKKDILLSLIFSLCDHFDLCVLILSDDF